jgi:glycosyltransferase involved in cell wall biosynthesis
MSAIEHWSADLASTPLRVSMLGLRGFPNVQGGVETHAQNLALGLVDLGCEVEVIVRSAFVAANSSRSWHKIKFVRLWSPRVKGLEAFVHSFLGVLYAAWSRPDILHIHAIGPALFTPLARALGLRVVVTHHVLNYDNEKWGWPARAILRLGERAGMMFANARIAVSHGLARRMEDAYGVPLKMIPNGIPRARKVASTATLQAFGLQPKRYVLMVARIDEQKRQLDLIDAFGRIDRRGWKLAIAGAADHSGAYARSVAEAAQKTPGVIMLGHQGGDALAELYTHAGVFVLASSHEGQPIAVLEAISYGCPLILSDISAHREICSSGARFVAVGDIAALANGLAEILVSSPTPRLDVMQCERVVRVHDWRQIAQQTFEVYRAAARCKSNGTARQSDLACD